MSDENDKSADQLVVENGDGEDDYQVIEEENGTETNQEESSFVMNSIDSSKEDMFVDAPEELNLDGREMVATTGSATEEMENGTLSNESVDDELKRLEEVLGKTVEEKERIQIESKKEVGYLRKQLIALTASLPGENGDHMGDKTVPLDDMVNECSNLIKFASQELLKRETTIKELHEIISMKDQHIQDLNAKVQLGEAVAVVVDRMFTSLGMEVYQEELVDTSVSVKVAQVERNIYYLMEKYNQMFYEIDQFRQCLSEPESTLPVQGEVGTTVLAVARGELLELKKKEVELVDRINHLEEENYKLVEQVTKERYMIEEANAQLGKTKIELEHEKNRCANTKEKLSLAVTKGKALVQQRDLLKHSLSEKTTELEKCRVQLLEASNALEDSLLCKQELVNCEVLVASLQETLLEKHEILHKFERMISLISIPEELQSSDLTQRFNWLMEERSILVDTSIEFQKLKDIISLVDVPEIIASADFQSRVSWLQQSFELAKSEVNMIRLECEKAIISAQNEIDRLTASMSVALQEKDYIKTELDQLSLKYEETLKMVHQISLEKDQMVKMLLDASKSAMDGHDEMPRSPDDLALLVDRCFMTIKNQNNNTSRAETEMFERIQILLYIKDQELMLCEELLEEEMTARSEINSLSTEINISSREIASLKEEKVLLQKDLQRFEEKSSLLKEKLTMAIKKGKGLVQDRENLRSILEEKSSDIEKLKLELEQKESTVSEHSARINVLSTNLEYIPKLETDLAAMKDQRDQLEKLLMERNNILQKVIESVECIHLPLDSEFKDPLEKLNRVSWYVNDAQQTKTDMEQELDKLKVEAEGLMGKLAEAHANIKSLEDALLISNSSMLQLAEKRSEIEAANKNIEQELKEVKEGAISLANELAGAVDSIKSLENALAVAQDNFSQLHEEKRGIEVLQRNMEEEMLKLKEKANSHLELEFGKVKEETIALGRKFAVAEETIKSLEDALSISQTNATEACMAVKSHEDALAVAENNISKLLKEKEEALNSKSVVETEVWEMREELVVQTSKLADAYETIKSLEHTLDKVENDVSLLTEQNKDVQAGRTSFESELQNLKVTTESQASELVNAFKTIKLLEEALRKAESDFGALEREKRMADQEISTLKLRLSACMEELEGKSSELIELLDSFHMLMKDESLLSTMNHYQGKNFENFKNMDLILNDIRSHFVNTNSEVLQGLPALSIMANQHLEMPFSCDFGDTINLRMEDGDINESDRKNISLCFRMAMDRFQSKNKILSDKLQGFCTSVDGLFSASLIKLEEIKDAIIIMSDYVESLNQKVRDAEFYKKESEKDLAMSANDLAVLLAACSDSIRELDFEVKDSLLELRSCPELAKLKHEFLVEQREAASSDTTDQSLERNKCLETSERMLSATKRVRTLSKFIESTNNVAAVVIEELQKELEVNRALSEKVKEEKDTLENGVTDLENHIELLQNTCVELRIKVDDLVTKLQEKEAILSSLSKSLQMKEQEEEAILSSSQARSLFDKLNGIDVPFSKLGVEDVEFLKSDPVKKLFYVVDSVCELQRQINVLSHEEEAHQSTLSRLTLEIKHLEEEIEANITCKQESEQLKSDISKFTFDIQKIIKMLGNDEIFENPISFGIMGFLSVLEKQAVALLSEAENSKYKVQNLGTKLIESEKVVDDLSTKIRLLEDSLQSRATTKSEIVQERSIFEPTPPTVADISDIGELQTGQKNAAPSAAHVRTMRKGSTDHLALNMVDLESGPLLNNEETVEDKGHVFKSLNTSGLVPKQGKMMADRIDGLWVSGGRILMSRPKTRLGLIAYCLLLHLWVLGTIL